MKEFDFSQKKVLIGLSGGINSMAVLCALANIPDVQKPKELHLFYAHFDEHSPDTRLFIEAGFAYAKRKFANVFCTITENSVLEFFEDASYIPHPKYSPCSSQLKIIPIMKYVYKWSIDTELIGFINTEQRRIERMGKKAKVDMFFTKIFPIKEKTNEWCFEIVSQEIGWYPQIYHIIKNGKRVFTHNNCLPCKNMSARQLDSVKEYYPDYYAKAMQLEIKTGQYFGRKECTKCKICDFD